MSFPTRWYSSINSVYQCSLSLEGSSPHASTSDHSSPKLMQYAHACGQASIPATSQDQQHRHQHQYLAFVSIYIPGPPSQTTFHFTIQMQLTCPLSGLGNQQNGDHDHHDLVFLWRGSTVATSTVAQQLSVTITDLMYTPQFILYHNMT